MFLPRISFPDICDHIILVLLFKFFFLIRYPVLNGWFQIYSIIYRWVWLHILLWRTFVFFFNNIRLLIPVLYHNLFHNVAYMEKTEITLVHLSTPPAYSNSLKICLRPQPPLWTTQINVRTPPPPGNIFWIRTCLLMAMVKQKKTPKNMFLPQVIFGCHI